jgi:hypothetical protein
MEILMFKDTSHFTVFGGAYVAERHRSDFRFDVDPRSRARQPGTASWIVLSALIAGLSVIAVELSYFAAGAHVWTQ